MVVMMKLKGRVFMTVALASLLLVLAYTTSLVGNLARFMDSGSLPNGQLRNRLTNRNDNGHLQMLRQNFDKSNYSSDNYSPDRDKLNKDGEVIAQDSGSRKEGLDIKDPSQFRVPYKNSQNATVFPEAWDRDIRNLINRLKKYFGESVLNRNTFDGDRTSHRKSRKRRGRMLSMFRTYTGENLTNWERFHLGLRQYSMYDPADFALDDLLADLTEVPIIDVEMKAGGTQLKLIMTYDDEGQALFKPMRYPRDTETLPNHFYFSDYERHNAEIASFHLDRILGFYRVPPTAGRVFNMTHDIKRLADRKLTKTFFISPADNVCFHGSCSYYCDTGHAICGTPDMLEGSLAAFLPPESVADRKTWRHPWRRSYSKHRKATWEKYDGYCTKVRENPPYDSGRRLLDIMDMAVFDFMIGNMDRHHYETFHEFGNDTFLMHLDQGRAFGRSTHDEMSILAPVIQCCLIRFSTIVKLISYYSGPVHLSDLMRTSLKKDSLPMLLTDAHLTALDRRVAIILREISQCLKYGNNALDVVVDDKF